MIKRARHACSPELKAAVQEYYAQMGQEKIESMRLIEYKYGDSTLDNVIVRLTDSSGDKLTTICSYDGYQGKLYHIGRPMITELEYCKRENEEEYISRYMNEEEEDL